MTFIATKARVHNRGVAPDSFLAEMVEWARWAPTDIFAVNAHTDIYSKVRAELGPYTGIVHRTAVMLEVLRVLALFESSGKWNEGVDTSRRTATNRENAEAGAWQVSFDARKLDPSLTKLLAENHITNGETFQQRMKADHPLAMTFAALLLRIDMKNFHRIANGPLRKGEERRATWPDRPKLWAANESIYPWLSRAAVAEFQALLA